MVLYLIIEMLLSLLKKAIHKNDEKTFSVANSVILKVANFQSNVAKKFAITLESKVAKRKSIFATLQSKSRQILATLSQK